MASVRLDAKQLQYVNPSQLLLLAQRGEKVMLGSKWYWRLLGSVFFVASLAVLVILMLVPIGTPLLEATPIIGSVDEVAATVPLTVVLALRWKQMRALRRACSKALSRHPEVREYGKQLALDRNLPLWLKLLAAMGVLTGIIAYIMIPYAGVGIPDLVPVAGRLDDLLVAKIPKIVFWGGLLWHQRGVRKVFDKAMSSFGPHHSYAQFRPSFAPA